LMGNQLYKLTTSSYIVSPYYCTSPFHLLGAGGSPLLPGLLPGPSAGGAGLIGRFITFCELTLLLLVRAG
jgi:hypothetical protein